MNQKQTTVFILASLVLIVAAAETKPKPSEKVEQQEIHSIGSAEFDKIYPMMVAEPTGSVEDIHFYLFTKQNPTNPDELFVGDINSLKISHFIPAAPVKVLTHGFMGNLKDALFPADLNSSYLNPKTRDLNVILVDWSVLAQGPEYNTAVFNVPIVAERTAILVEFLVQQNYTTLENLHLIGHSLGAHIAGETGFFVQKVMGRKVARATGLDPAKPLFEFANNKSRIDPSDAEFVDIIHTTGLTLGLLRTLGHADFYPNGGITQPGCFIDLGCDHSRAHQYFSESVLNPQGFKACLCAAKTLDRTLCSCNGSNPDSISHMGEYAKSSSRGIFWLESNSEPLYSMS